MQSASDKKKQKHNGARVRTAGRAAPSSARPRSTSTTEYRRLLPRLEQI
jgi:hypothetical protein